MSAQQGEQAAQTGSAGSADSQPEQSGWVDYGQAAQAAQASQPDGSQAPQAGQADGSQPDGSQAAQADQTEAVDDSQKARHTYNTIRTYTWASKSGRVAKEDPQPGKVLEIDMSKSLTRPGPQGPPPGQPGADLLAPGDLQ